jgi:hypothetical protein
MTQPAETQTGPRSTALVATAADRTERRPLPGGHRADAGFLAHLLAIRAGMPEHRAKRRAAPERGAAAYGMTAGLSEAACGRTGFARDA